MFFNPIKAIKEKIREAQNSSATAAVRALGRGGAAKMSGDAVADPTPCALGALSEAQADWFSEFHGRDFTWEQLDVMARCAYKMPRAMPA